MLGGAVLGAERALVAERLLVALELGRGGEQRPDLAVLEPHEAIAPEGVGLEGEPSCRDAALLRDAGRRIDRPCRGLAPRQLRLQHRADGVLALDRLDVPGEGDKIAPVAIVLKQRNRPLDVIRSERLAQIRQHMADPTFRRHIEHRVPPLPEPVRRRERKFPPREAIACSESTQSRSPGRVRSKVMQSGGAAE